MNLARLALAATSRRRGGRLWPDHQTGSGHLGALMGMAVLASTRATRWIWSACCCRPTRPTPRALQPIVVLAEGYLRKNDGPTRRTVLSGLPPEQAEVPGGVAFERKWRCSKSGDFASAMFTLNKLTAAQPDSTRGMVSTGARTGGSGRCGGFAREFPQGHRTDADFKVPVVWAGLAELELREQQFDTALRLRNRSRRISRQRAMANDIETAAYRGKGLGRPRRCWPPKRRCRWKATPGG